MKHSLKLSGKLTNHDDNQLFKKAISLNIFFKTRPRPSWTKANAILRSCFLGCISSRLVDVGIGWCYSLGYQGFPRLETRVGLWSHHDTQETFRTSSRVSRIFLSKDWSIKFSLTEFLHLSMNIMSLWWFHITSTWADTAVQAVSPPTSINHFHSAMNRQQLCIKTARSEQKRTMLSLTSPELRPPATHQVYQLMQQWVIERFFIKRNDGTFLLLQLSIKSVLR